MRIHRYWFLSLLSLLPLLGGCGLGFTHTLFVTKSNVGIDIDTKPPTAEISIARKELVIAPGFGGGQTPPVLAGFDTGNRFLFGFDVSSAFAGGDAAAILSRPGTGKAHDAVLCVTSAPKGELRMLGVPLAKYELPAEGQMHPFVFGTDTSFGVKVAWSGMTAQFPDTLKVGFNRKEVAIAPVFGRENATNCRGKEKYGIEMPAFLATIKVKSDLSTPTTAELGYRQSFATGAAAVSLAGDDEVKADLRKRIDVSSATDVYGPDDNSACISQWLSPDPNADPVDDRLETIQSWWQSKGHPATSINLLVSGGSFGSERSEFIKHQAIQCTNGG